MGTAEELLEKFDLTVLRRDDDAPDAHIPLRGVLKWDRSIRLNIANPRAQAEIDYISELATQLSNLTGLSISLEEGEREVSIRVVPREEFQTTVESVTGGRLSFSAAGTAICSVYAYGGRIPKGHVIVTYYPEKERVQHLLLTEITQCLGPGGDFGGLLPSVFTESGRLHRALPLNDQIILRTLYDSRIPPGMRREYTLEAASEIIPLLLHRLQEKGPKGLYQSISD